MWLRIRAAAGRACIGEEKSSLASAVKTSEQGTVPQETKVSDEGKKENGLLVAGCRPAMRRRGREGIRGRWEVDQ